MATGWLRWVLIGLVGAAALDALVQLVWYALGGGALVGVVAAVAGLGLTAALYLGIVELSRWRARQALQRSARRARRKQTRGGPFQEMPTDIRTAVAQAVAWEQLRQGEEAQEEAQEEARRLPVPSAPRVPGKGLGPLTPEVSSVTAIDVPPLASGPAVSGPVRLKVTPDAVVQPLIEPAVTRSEMSDKARRLVSRPDKGADKNMDTSSAGAMPGAMPVAAPVATSVTASVDTSVDTSATVVGIVSSTPAERVFPASTGKPGKKRKKAPPPPPVKRTVADLYRRSGSPAGSEVQP